MGASFYSPASQRRREIRTLWRTSEPRDILTGLLLVLVSFYLFRHPGQSQVYNASIPFVMISAYLGILIVLQGRLELQDRCGAYFDMLPRSPEAAFDGKLAWYLLHATIFVAAIGLGCALKLGGADVTPVYRLHPEIVILPYATVPAALWFIHIPPTSNRAFDGIIAIALIGVVVVAHLVTLPESTAANNWMPARFMPLRVAFAIAAGLLALTAWLAHRIRPEYRRMRALE